MKNKFKLKNMLICVSITLLVMLATSGLSLVEAKIPVVVINPGHSLGYDSGAVGNGLEEAQINSDIAAKVGTLLQKAGYSVYLTHPANGYLGRTLLSGLDASTLHNLGWATNSVNPDIAMSIHTNSGASTASGYEFYWSSYKANLDSTDVYEVRGLWSNGDSCYRDVSPCTEAIGSRNFAAILARDFNGLALPYRQTVERDDYLPAHANCPCVLLESGFVSNSYDASLLSSAWYQNDEAARIVQSINDYFGGSPIKDETPPVAQSVSTDESSTTDAVFTVYANGVTDSGTGVQKVMFPVWSVANGQDDLIWYQGEYVGNNQWKATIDIADHGNNLGNYTIHAYGYDYSGNSALMGATSVRIKAMDDSIPNGISVSKLSNEKYKIYAKGFSGYHDYYFPTWSISNDQDDLIWYTGTRQTDGSYAHTVDIMDHNYDTGSYAAHVYATNSSGVQVGLGATTFNVPAMSAGNISVSKIENGQFSVTISDIIAPQGINTISVPVWSANNGQDDIIWYKANKQSDGSYKAIIDLSNHKYDEGVYYIHVYGQNNYNSLNFLGNTSITVKGMTATNITAGSIENGKCAVTINGVNAPTGVKNILVPVWSANGGQDDIVWYTANKQLDGSFQATINLANHKYDDGTYYIHVYGVNNYDKLTFLGNTEISVKGMTAASITAGDIANGKCTVTISGVNAPAGVKNILVPVWSANGGQDDIVWYTANRQWNGSYQATIDLANHKYDGGTYYIHVYGVNNYDKLTFLGNTDITVKGMTADSIQAGAVNNGQCTVSIVGVNAPAGLKNILVPVWSANNGQDDIVWYSANKQTDGSYQATINLADHKYDEGIYYIHVYGVNNYDRLTFLGNTSINVAQNEEYAVSYSSNTNIMGTQGITKDQMIDFYNTKAAFPSYYTDRGVSLSDFVQMYIDEGNAEGVRPEIAFAQMCVETGYLKFGGQVKINQFNFAGLGATDNGAGGADFSSYGDNATGIRMGIRAQIQHLKAYASTEALNNALVDPRFNLVSRGIATKIGDLGNGRWATDANYATKLLNILQAM